MHRYELWAPIEIQCVCCQVPTTFTFRSKYDHVICPPCQRHIGTSPSRLKARDAEHIELWRDHLGRVTAEFEERISALHTKVWDRDSTIAAMTTQVIELRETLKAGLLQMPPETVRAWLDSEARTGARAEVDRAYRSRAHAFRALWAVDALHRDGKADLCSCGNKQAQCSVWKALEPVRQSLYQWEDKQIERVRRGFYDHELPHDHPEVNPRASRFGTRAS